MTTSRLIIFTFSYFLRWFIIMTVLDIVSVLPISPLKYIYIYIYIYFFFCSEFCHTLEWNSHGLTCVPHPNPPSHLPLHLLLLGFPSAPGPSACLMHPTWAGDLFHPRYYTCFDAVLLKHPTLAFSLLEESKRLFYKSVSFF